MDFLINESQLRIILQEQDESKMTDYMKTMYSFTKNLANRVNKVYGLNVKMLLTWGTSVGGLVMPLDKFIRDGNFELTDDQRYLVLAGIAFVTFYENKVGLVKILKKIKEEGLEDVFRLVLEKAIGFILVVLNQKAGNPYLKNIQEILATIGMHSSVITHAGKN